MLHCTKQIYDCVIYIIISRQVIAVKQKVIYSYPPRFCYYKNQDMKNLILNNDQINKTILYISVHVLLCGCAQTSIIDFYIIFF